MSWARDAVAAIRKIVLIEERVTGLTEQVKRIADAYSDLDRRLLRLEAKFEFIERVAAGRGSLPEKSQKLQKSKKSK